MSKRKTNNCLGSCTLCSVGLSLKTCTLPIGLNGFNPADTATLVGELTRLNKRAKLATNAVEVIIIARNVSLIEEELIKRNIL
jgi:hypothetical protein